MELYNIEKKPLRKKDKEAYYYDDKGRFSPVPGMFDSKEEVFAFVMSCAKRSIPKVTNQMLEEVWEEGEEKKIIILEALEQLKREHESAADYFKSAAYGRAIPAIKKLQVPLLSGAQAQKIKGIGKGIGSHIDEILRSGRLKSVEEREEYRIQRQKAVETFTKIWGVTAKIAGEWYTQGYESIEDVPDAELTDQQKAGIKYMDELTQQIPREEISEFADELTAQLVGTNGVEYVDIVGVYRRGAAEVEAIDIMVSVDESQKIGKPLFRKIVAILEKAGIITDAPVFGTKKFMGVAQIPGSKIHHRIDIALVYSDARGAALIHSTGPQAFVVHLKEMAAQQQYKLTEEGLFKLTSKDDEEDEKISVPSEKDVFSALKMQYTDPEDRF